MAFQITQLLGIEHDEKRLISTLLLQSVFIGIFFGVFNIVAHSLFLAKFDETYMAKAYIVSGIVGGGLTWLYTRYQDRSRFISFSFVNLGFIFLVTMVLWFLFRVYVNNLVIFSLFIMLGPLNLLALLGFYGTVGRLFTLRQGRRLFGLVDTGLVVGAIISSFAIPAILALKIQTHDLLLISAAGVIGALFIQIFIGNNFSLAENKKHTPEDDEGGLKIFRKERYIRSMGIFIALSMVVMFFIQYSFMGVTRERFPGEHEMANFLGLFEGSMMVFTLIIKTFLFSYLIKEFGLKVTITIGPFLIGFFAIIATLITIFMGVGQGTPGFMIFFLVLAMSRLFSKALKDSVETPAFKVLYQTVAEKIRFRVQSAIDGTINEISALSSGLLLTGLGALAFFKLIHFSWVLCGVVVLWIISGFRLYSEYRNSVRRSLDTRGHAIIDEEINRDESVLKYRILFRISPLQFIIQKYRSEGISKNVAAQRAIAADSHINTNPMFLGFIQELSLNTSENNRDDLLSIVKNLRNRSLSNPANNNPYEYPLTGGKENRRGDIYNIVFSEEKLTVNAILRLIRDKDPEIRRAGLIIAAQDSHEKLIPDICNCLSDSDVRTEAYCALGIMGDKAFDHLETAFLKSSGQPLIRLLITRIFSESGNVNAGAFLLSALTDINRDVRKEALKGLIYCGFVVDEETKDRLLQMVQEIIGLMTRIISCLATIEKNRDTSLEKAMYEDYEWWRRFLFELLSVIYDKNSVNKIQENIEVGTVENTNFALEMLDIVVDDTIKPRLSALLDLVSYEDKLKTLFQFYPGSVPQFRELITDIINSDYNQLSVWTKKEAIRSLYETDELKEKESIVALLFNPSQLLREEAALLLKRFDPGIFERVEGRIPPQYIPGLRDIFSDNNPGELIADKVNMLDSIFNVVNSSTLIDISMHIRRVDQSELVQTKGRNNSIMFYRQKMKDTWGLVYNGDDSAIQILENNSQPDEGFYSLGINELSRVLFIRNHQIDYIITTIEEHIK